MPAFSGSILTIEGRKTILKYTHTLMAQSLGYKILTQRLNIHFDVIISIYQSEQARYLLSVYLSGTNDLPPTAFPRFWRRRPTLFAQQFRRHSPKDDTIAYEPPINPAAGFEMTMGVAGYRWRWDAIDPYVGLYVSRHLSVEDGSLSSPRN